MINIVQQKEVTFYEFQFDIIVMKNAIENYRFFNQRPVTKSMLVWWALQDESQELLPLTDTFEIEHIFAKNRQENEKILTNADNLELLGNKSVLEKRINIRASDYRFMDKKKYYEGFINARGVEKEGTKIKELRKLATEKTDFKEEDMKQRNEKIINEFLKYLERKKLIKIKN